MPSQPLDDPAWAPLRDDLHRLIRADIWHGVSKWFDHYAHACLANDHDLCRRLVTESSVLPDVLRELADRRFRPAVDALQSGQWTTAIELLTAPGRTGQIVSTLASAPIAAPTRDADLNKASAWGLQGTWWEALGRKIEAAAAFFEAGKHLGMLGNEHDEALVHLLHRATELDPTHALAHWHLADAWRVRSNSPVPPYVDRPTLEQSLAAWNSGAASQLPDAETSWAYLVRAMIGEQFARLDDARRLSHLWDAVLYLERAMLLDDADASRWALLGRYHRLLGNERAALHATAKARERDPDLATALEERAAILADTGDFAEARLLVDRRIGLDPQSPTPWALSVKAYILAHLKDYQTARELIAEVSAAEPDNIWNLDLNATCCWMLGDLDGARDIYEAIARVGAATRLGIDDRRTCAFAAYRLGRTDAAIAALEELSDDPLLRDDVSRLLGLCYFVKGEIRRAEELILSRMTSANARELDDFLSLELCDLERPQSRVRPGPDAVASLARIKAIATALADRARAPVGDARLAAEQELTPVVQSGDGAGPADAATAAAMAGVARLQLEREHWRGAVATFRALQRADGLFPEATVGMDRAVAAIRTTARKLLDERQLPAALEGFGQLVAVETELARGQTAAAHQDLAEALWSAGRDTEAMTHFREALAQSPRQDDAWCADLYGRLGLALQLEGDAESARDSYLHALRLYRHAGSGDPGRALADACRLLFRGAGDFWAVDAQWRLIAKDASADPVARGEFARAADSIASYLDGLYRLSEPLTKETAIPLVTPIALEVGSAIVPLVDPSAQESENGKFLNKDIPAMRERVQRSMGLRNVPGIRVRSQPASTEEYVLMLDGVPVARGRVRAQAKFFVESTDAPESALPLRGASEEADPASGLVGRWCPTARLRSETEFILSHVETELRKHLDAFLGVDDVGALLADVRKDESLAALTSALPDEGEFLDALMRVLRALLRENIPVTDWSSIGGVIASHRLSSVDEVVREVRLRLKEQLPGNQEGTTCIQIPAEWERGGSDVAETEFAGASPELANQQLVSIRRWLEARQGKVALVTATAQFRPVVRRLIEFEFPSVPVLSLDEVIHPERVVPAAEAAANVAESRAVP